MVYIRRFACTRPIKLGWYNIAISSFIRLFTHVQYSNNSQKTKLHTILKDKIEVV